MSSVSVQEGSIRYIVLFSIRLIISSILIYCGTKVAKIKKEMETGVLMFRRQ